MMTSTGKAFGKHTFLSKQRRNAVSDLYTYMFLTSFIVSLFFRLMTKRGFWIWRSSFFNLRSHTEDLIYI